MEKVEKVVKEPQKPTPRSSIRRGEMGGWEGQGVDTLARVTGEGIAMVVDAADG